MEMSGPPSRLRAKLVRAAREGKDPPRGGKERRGGGKPESPQQGALREERQGQGEEVIPTPLPTHFQPLPTVPTPCVSPLFNLPIGLEHPG